MAVHRRAQALRYLALLALVACASQPKPDNAAICTAYAGQGGGQAVVAQGRVGESAPHAFLLQLSGSCDLLLQVDATAVQGTPISAGERVVVSGTYTYSITGGQLKATAISPAPPTNTP